MTLDDDSVKVPDVAEAFEDIADNNSVGLSDEDIREITDALHDDTEDSHIELVNELSIADTAELLQKITQDDRKALLENPKVNIQPEVFAYIDSALRKATLSVMSPKQVAKIISELESDDALDLIQNLDEEFQQEIIRKLSAKIRIAIEEGLTFPEDSAGRLMQREYVAVPQFWTVGKVIDYLRAAGDDLPDDFYDIIVIDPLYHVVGEIPLNRILRSKRSKKIEELTLDDLHTIPADMDQEEVSYIFRREGLNSAPVVDADNRLIGVITFDDIIDVIDEEAQEDILKLAGVEGGDLYRAVLSTTGSRFRWLFINLITAIAASIVISFFDATIEQVVALAVLMPIVASMGGNAGTQALTVAVRALATKELSSTNMMRVIGKETLVGTLNGMGFAIIMGLIAAFWFQNVMLGVVIAVAMIINLVFAGLCGAGI
ncbi:MAG TPA: magnesium transporter, partial [Alphaproteobacteria bacterium]|nr:magnesium transporter [Alphaproteobacteria bacterium]